MISCIFTQRAMRPLGVDLTYPLIEIMHYLRRLIVILTSLLMVCFKTAFADVIDVNNKELQRLLSNDVKIVDLRRLDEWKQTGVVENSIELTFFDKHGRHTAQQWLETVSGLVDTEEPVILICHSGVRSKVVANWLNNVSEYPQIYNVTSGIAAWIDQGLPVVSTANQGH
ncbi:MAG: rhodanese-like domain-containing protein [Gammaproteobacteria bacterium]|nr:rhodanese-like domain-containing protein [Gammaproteobacteria bacterium]NKB63189.1 rhodanese-like domain-containing protein [Gammaproteobacteria bacterium]